MSRGHTSRGSKDRLCVVEQEFREDLSRWVREQRRVAERVLDLVEGIMRDPFQGKGKPEPLKSLLPNT
ncbi:MAG: type II toxin-antitoxin system YoeB family toxin [Myxococcaceae bacterium]